MQQTIKQKIVVHVSYRNIFNAPVRISDCQKWLGIETHNSKSFNEALDELINENLISVEDGFMCVRGNEDTIKLQPEKDQLSSTLLAKGGKTLSFLSKLPFVRYIGVSGSVAANNPTLQLNGRGNEFVDLDLFVICKSNSLWLLFLVERVLTNFKRLFVGHHFYCFNYVTDESFLEIYNKNFYTATEIKNLKTIYDDNIFFYFLKENKWYEKYYPHSRKSELEDKQQRYPKWTLLLAPLNFACFAIFCLGRAIKRLEIAPLFEVVEGFNPVQKCNLKRISNPNGGYQEAIKKKFQDLHQKKFPSYFSEGIMEDLFPSSSAFTFLPKHNVHDKENAELFTKYTLNSNEKNPI
ncbi:hypothetical protein [Ekhidna sp. To15]|uniref:hypothetical protein n=1 Tax=Ekhidna sp. To15 TaxID=3395267 RepID=UPI003F526DBD